MVPAEKEAQHLPCGHRGTIRAPDWPGRLLGASAAQNPQSAEKQKQATWEALLSLLHKSQGKRKNISCPYTPADLHPSSLQQTNIAEDEQTRHSVVVVVVVMSRFRSIKMRIIISNRPRRKIEEPTLVRTIFPHPGHTLRLLLRKAIVVKYMQHT